MSDHDWKSPLLAAGAALVGYADLRDLPDAPLPYGICVALPLPRTVLRDIQDGPTRSYYDAYHQLNHQLNDLVTLGAALLQEAGFAALPQTTDVVKQDETWQTPLPHKSVALRAGLGWIGKNNLLVTPEFGSALRISSLLTDAPLPCAAPQWESRCGDCTACRRVCPAGAIYGRLWTPGTHRDDMFDRIACMDKQHELMRQRTGIDADLCGQCFVACPHTRQYLNSAQP